MRIFWAQIMAVVALLLAQLLSSEVAAQRRTPTPITPITHPGTPHVCPASPLVFGAQLGPRVDLGSGVWLTPYRGAALIEMPMATYVAPALLICEVKE